MRTENSTLDQEISRIARRQHGIVTRTQLLAIGVSAAGIKRRIAKGTLHIVHRAVYRVGHTAPSREATYMAAVLACGAGGLLSGRAAGHLYRLLRSSTPLPEVTSPTQRRIAGVITNRSRAFEQRDATRYRGIPVMTVPRTLVDLAGMLSTNDLAVACHEAEIRFRVGPDAVEAVLARRPTSPGAAMLRGVLRGDVHVTLSELERRFLEVLREAALPLPQTNRLAGTRRVDCRWPDRRLTVELDSYRYHHSRHAWEQDRRREREAYARGDDFRRFTYGDVCEQPQLMLAELRSLLRRGQAGPR